MKRLLLFVSMMVAIGFFTTCRKSFNLTQENEGEIVSQSNNSPVGVSENINSQKYAPNEIIVKFRSGLPDQAFMRTQKAVIKEKILTEAMKSANYSGIHVLMVPDVSRAVDAFKNNPNVEWANPNFSVHHEAYTPTNDPYWGNLWGISNVNAPTAFNAGNIGDQAVYVGVIDEGIMYWHEDLCGQIWDNPYETVNGKDDDGNGYIDDIHGWDFMHMDNTIFDNADNHGTHVAGTIGGIGNNGKGVVGMSPNVTMISGKFLEGSGWTSDAIKAVDYMTDLKTRHGMNIATTSNSWGGSGYDQGLYDAINRAKAQNILFVAAAGNDGMNTDVTANYPSCYNLDNIISVAAYNSGETLPSWTNWGANTVDIGAPGVTIYSTLAGTNGASTYGAYSGTSMATPHVAGAVALYKAGNPTATYTQVKSAILSNARAISALTGKCVTGGVLNVSTFTKATTNSQTPRSCVVPPVDATPPSTPTNIRELSRTSNSAVIAWDPSTDNVGVAKYTVAVPYSWYTATTTVSGTTTQLNVTGLGSGVLYNITINAYDAWGNKSGDAKYTINFGNDTIPPTTPKNFKIVGIDATSVTFSYDWSTDDWSGVALYRIRYRVASCSGCNWSGWHTNGVNPLAVPYLTTGTQYAFTIAAMDNNNNWSPESSPALLATPSSDITPPTSPTLSVTNKTSSSVSLSWTSSTDNVSVKGYRVYYKVSSSATWALASDVGNVTTYTASSLSSNTSYDFYAVSYDFAGNVSAPSNTATQTTDPPDTTPPSAPTLSVTGKTLNSVSLSWTASTDNIGVTGYRVYYKASTSSTWILYSTQSTRTITLTGLVGNTSYDSYVTAYDAAGNVSVASNTVTQRTDGPTYIVSTGLTGSLSKKTYQTLSWTSSISPSGWNIARTELQNIQSGWWTTIYTQTTQSLTGKYTIIVNNRYLQQYRVVTTLASGEIAYSNVVGLTSNFR